MELLPQQEAETSVYRYYDQHRVLIYVGITKRGIARQSEHNRGREWWPFVTSQEVEHFPSREEAHAREVELIERYTPPFNRQHNPIHEHMRSAYLTVAQSADVNIDPLAMMQALGRRLPLVAMGTQQQDEHTILLMRTEPAHVSLTSRLQYDGKIRLTEPTGPVLGTVLGIEQRGPFAVLRIRVRRGFHLDTATAVVKQLTAKKPVAFALRRVLLDPAEQALPIAG